MKKKNKKNKKNPCRFIVFYSLTTNYLKNSPYINLKQSNKTNFKTALSIQDAACIKL